MRRAAPGLWVWRLPPGADLGIGKQSRTGHDEHGGEYDLDRKGPPVVTSRDERLGRFCTLTEVLLSNS